jgi:preprotein translocase subunit SecD
MRRRKAIIQLTVFVLIAVVALGLTLRSGNTPLLGLDLQGGVSVVLSPKTPAGEEELNQAIEIMRQRIDALGVAEPEITRQGNNILVNIAGVKDTDAAIAQVGQTAELRFRPVLQVLPPEDAAPAEETPPGTDVPGSTVPGDPGTTVPGDPATTSDSVTTDSITPGSTAPEGEATEGALGLAPGESAAGGQETPTTDPTASDLPTETTVPADPTATTVPADPTATTILTDPTATTPLTTSQTGSLATTPPDQDLPDQIVVLPEYDADGNVTVRYQLGPTQLTGSALEGASAGIDPQTGQWVVFPKFKPGADGIDAFNAAAQVCHSKSAECPTGMQAITLDGRVVSAPQIQPKSSVFQPFSADQVNISGSFDQDSANDLANALRYGALPIELERQSTQIVSATLGIDALHAGLIAGLVGLILAAIYMGLFYRILGAMSLLKLGIEAMLLYSIVTWLGVWAGLSLTLAGVTGIIVSIGVSLDSNVVYYEHLREDVRNGRTIRSAVDRSFHASFSTILKANGASILGAALLYFLAVGPVRGFAFFLGLSTVLDLVTSYFFMRPVVFHTTSAELCERRPAFFGLPYDAADRAEAVRARPSRAGRGAAARGSGAEDDDGGDAGVGADAAERTGASS